MAENKRADTLAVNCAFRAMAGMLNDPKKIDEIKRCPAYVKDGVIYDFLDRKFHNTNTEDVVIFKLDRVLKAQAVTVALKRDYTNALNAWLDGDTEEVKETPVEKTETVEAVDVDKIRKLLGKGKLKKAKKLLAEAKDLLGKKEYKALKKEVENAEGDA